MTMYSNNTDIIALVDSPVFKGEPQAPHPTTSSPVNQLVTVKYVKDLITAIPHIDLSPYATNDSPVFIGTPKVETPSTVSPDLNQIVNVDFIRKILQEHPKLTGAIFSGVVKGLAPDADSSDDTFVTSKWVRDHIAASGGGDASDLMHNVSPSFTGTLKGQRVEVHRIVMVEPIPLSENSTRVPNTKWVKDVIGSTSRVGHEITIDLTDKTDDTFTITDDLAKRYKKFTFRLTTNDLTSSPTFNLLVDPQADSHTINSEFTIISENESIKTIIDLTDNDAKFLDNEKTLKRVATISSPYSVTSFLNAGVIWTEQFANSTVTYSNTHD